MNLSKGKFFLSILVAAIIGGGVGYGATKAIEEPTPSPTPTVEPSLSPSPSPSAVPVASVAPASTQEQTKSEQQQVLDVVRLYEVGAKNQNPDIAVQSVSGSFAKATVARSATYFLKKVDGTWIVVQFGQSPPAGDDILKNNFGFPDSALNS